MAPKIMDVAERRVRREGYNGFSFRRIADEIGIKSASVHYHFANKGELGAAITARYADRFMDAIGPPEAEEALAQLVAGFRHSLVEDRAMCLCGMLASERDGLPEAVQVQVAGFFRRLLDWLVSAYKARKRAEPEVAAAQALATLEGALLVARSLEQPVLFERAVSGLVC